MWEKKAEDKMIYLWLAYSVILSAIIIYQIYLWVRAGRLREFFREKGSME